MSAPVAYINVATDEGASGVTMSSASQTTDETAMAGASTRQF